MTCMLSTTPREQLMPDSFTPKPPTCRPMATPVLVEQVSATLTIYKGGKKLLIPFTELAASFSPNFTMLVEQPTLITLEEQLLLHPLQLNLMNLSMSEMKEKSLLSLKR